MSLDEPTLLTARDIGAAPVLAFPLRLIVVRGAQVGRRFVVDTNGAIGRSSRCDVVIHDATVSRMQAMIAQTPKGVCLRDASGRNTLRINGIPQREHMLAFGDKIEMGATMLLVAPSDASEEERLEQQRIQSLGYLSSGIAHDFNNMLGVILSTLGYIRELGPRTLNDPDVLECLDDLQTAGERSAELVKRILAFAKREQERHALIDFGKVCADVVHLTTRAFPGTIRVETAIERRLWVRGARAQLAQMIMNLLINARDAMPEGGTLTIRAELQDKRVVFDVRDTGTGMDATTRARLFERFFTTKQAKGTGLGLATVAEVVRWHGASIDVTSEIDQGTVFQVRFPPAEPTSVTAKRTIAIQRPTSRRVIMVVDDDHVVRRAITRILRSAHDVVEVADPRKVTEEYERVQPDLVLLDLDMAPISGREVWQRLEAEHVGAPVAFVSGHGGDSEAKLTREGALGFLQKPFGSDSLRAFVAGLLAER